MDTLLAESGEMVLEWVGVSLVLDDFGRTETELPNAVVDDDWEDWTGVWGEEPYSVS